MSLFEKHQELIEKGIRSDISKNLVNVFSELDLKENVDQIKEAWELILKNFKNDKNKHKGIISYIFHNHPEIFDFNDFLNYTDLSTLTKEEKENALLNAVENNFQVNLGILLTHQKTKDFFGSKEIEKAITVAISNKHTEIVGILLEHKAVSLSKEAVKTLLTHTIGSDQSEIMKLFLTNDHIKANLPENFASSLFLCVNSDKVAVAETIFNNVDPELVKFVNEEGNQVEQALYQATGHNAKDFVVLLLNNPVSQKYITEEILIEALKIAFKVKNIDITEPLLSSFNDHKIMDKAFGIAVEVNYHQAVNYIINKYTLSPEALESSLRPAVNKNYSEIAGIILDHEKGKDIGSEQLKRTLIIAARNNNIEIVNSILDHARKHSKEITIANPEKKCHLNAEQNPEVHAAITGFFNARNHIAPPANPAPIPQDQAVNNVLDGNVEQPNPEPVPQEVHAQEPIVDNNQLPPVPPVRNVPPAPATNPSILARLTNVISKVVNWENLLIGGILSANSVQNLLKSNNAWKGFTKLIAPAANIFENAIESAVSNLALRSETQGLLKGFIRSSAPIIFTIAAVKAITVFRNTNQTNGLMKSLFSAIAAFAETVLEGGVSNIAAAAVTTIATAAVATLEAGIIASAAPVVATMAGAAIGAYTVKGAVCATKASASWAGNKAKSFVDHVASSYASDLGF
ncbi:MAG: hypothetical protein ACK4OM_01410 [Alphaproteobacteria bacterium]